MECILKQITTATRHAQERIIERGVSMLEVEEVLNYPLQEYRSRRTGTPVFVGFVRGTELKVYAVEKADGTYHLKSVVFRTRKGTAR